MNISSPAFEHNQPIPAKYTCDADDISPPLIFSDVPQGTKSFVMIHDDPDATAGTWVHWTLWNIPGETRNIAENSIPEGSMQGITSFGQSKYGGPCPPSGTHRYFFKLYALDTKLQIDPNTTAEGIEKALESHVLARAELIGLYQRQGQ